VGVAAAPGTAVTRPGSGNRETGGVSLWRRLVQVVRRSSGANATEAERILLEADFGVEATQQILAAVSGATEGDFRAAVERAVTEALVADGLGDPGALARAATPPTVILVFGVNGVGKTTTVAKLAARLARDGRSVLLAAADTFRGGAAQRARRDQTRRDRQGRERGRAQARGSGPGAVSRDGGGPGRSRSLRRGTVRPAPGGRLVTLQLTTSVKYLKGVGPKRADALARLGIRTVGDLLYHAPHRYLDATTVTPLHKVQVGQEATCVGRVVSTGALPTRKGLRVFRAVLRDDSGGGPLEGAWPGQACLQRQIRKGQLLLVTGPVRYYHGRQLV